MAGIRIAGLWEKQGANNQVYYEGSFGGAIMRIYSNSYKTEAKHPDLVVYLSEKPKEGQRKASPAFKAKVTPSAAPAARGVVKGVVRKAIPNSAPNATRRPAVEEPPDFNDIPWPEGPDDHDSEQGF
jgi:hypothetical protein